MVVVITNLTDGPGKRPIEVKLFSKRLLPGKSMRIPAQYVDTKMRALEEAGFISIGALPTWYAEHKAKPVLNAAGVAAARKRASDVAQAKAAGNKAAADRKKGVSAAPAAPAKAVALVDKVETQDETKAETKSGKRNKRRG